MPENRTTDLGTFSGGQLLLVFLAVVCIGVILGQRWPTGRIAWPSTKSRFSIRLLSWTLLSAPAIGFVYGRTGRPLNYDQVDFLVTLYLTGAFLSWWLATRKPQPE